VTAFSCNVSLADAWATSACNRIRPSDHSVPEEVDPEEVSGIFSIMGETVVRWGTLPPLVPAAGDAGLKSAGETGRSPEDVGNWADTSGLPQTNEQGFSTHHHCRNARQPQ